MFQRQYSPLCCQPIREKSFEKLQAELKTRNSKNLLIFEKFAKRALRKQIQRSRLPSLNRMRTEPTNENRLPTTKRFRVSPRIDFRRQTKKILKTVNSGVLLGVINIRLDMGGTVRESRELKLLREPLTENNLELDKRQSSYHKKRGNFRAKPPLRPTKEIKFTRQPLVFCDDWNLISINTLTLPRSQRIHGD